MQTASTNEAYRQAHFTGQFALEGKIVFVNQRIHEMRVNRIHDGSASRRRTCGKIILQAIEFIRRRGSPLIAKNRSESRSRAGLRKRQIGSCWRATACRRKSKRLLENPVLEEACKNSAVLRAAIEIGRAHV